MNENHSASKSKLKDRWLVPSLLKKIKHHTIIVLLGPFHSGKTTLLKNHLRSGWKYISLEDYVSLDQWKKDPYSFLNSEKILIDDIQKDPDIVSFFDSIQNCENPKKIILAGSANLFSNKEPVFCFLFPVTQGEIKSSQAPDIVKVCSKNNWSEIVVKKEQNLDSLLFQGCLPAFLSLSMEEEYRKWWEEYLAFYLEREIRQYSQIDSLTDFRKVMECVALCSGKLLNQTEIARNIGIGQSTVYRYLHLMEMTCMLWKIPPFLKKETKKRMIKSPSYYYTDPGLVACLCGCKSEEGLRNNPEKESIFKTFIFLHLLAAQNTGAKSYQISYWKTVTGKEVPFVLEQGEKIIPLAVTLSENPSLKDAEGLNAFMEEYPEVKRGIIVYKGKIARFLDQKRILALPWPVFTGMEN